MHWSPLRNRIISIVTDLWRKTHIVTKQNALFNETLNFFINFRSVKINLHKGVHRYVFQISLGASEFQKSTTGMANFFHGTGQKLTILSKLPLNEPLALISAEI